MAPVLALGFAGAGTAMAVPASLASAQTTGPLTCGSVITHSTTLTHDIGPCPADGLIVGTSNVTLDLGGHTVSGATLAIESTGPAEQVGINLTNVSGVRVVNGTVTGFDAGVSITGGSGNTVTQINAHDNINDTAINNNQRACNFGDGIAVDNSNNNRIINNAAVHNGPFSGISLVDASGGNLLANNRVANNNVPNLFPNGMSGFCGPFAPFSNPGGRGRVIQDQGIRIEGPGATNNRVVDNQVTNSSVAGIGVFGNLCHPPAGNAPQPANNGTSIIGNTVTATGATNATQPPTINGRRNPLFDSDGNGIGVLEQGPLGVVTCAANNTTIVANNSSGNFRDGIFVSKLSSGNTIKANTVNNNKRDGITLDGPFNRGPLSFPGAHDNTLIANNGHGNARVDGVDLNPNCDNNRWVANRFGTVNQPCVAANGGTGTVKVFANSASGAITAKTLSVSFSGPVNVVNPTGFTVYSDSSCTTLVGTGQQPVTNNGTFTPTVSLSGAPTPKPPATRANAFFEVAANSVTSNGVGNAAVPCTPVTFG